MEALVSAGHTVADAVNDAIRASITRLIQTHEVDLDAYPGPVYFMMHGLESEEVNSPPHSTPPCTESWNPWPTPSRPHPVNHATSQADISCTFRPYAAAVGKQLLEGTASVLVTRWAGTPRRSRLALASPSPSSTGKEATMRSHPCWSSSRRNP
jgi:hypothetical protein